MSSVQFACTDAVPRMARATNIPSSGAFTYVCAVEFTYANWGEIFYLGNGTNELVGIEFDAGGNVYLYRDSAATSFTTINILTGSQSGWIRMALVGDGVNFQTYYQTAGGLFTTGAALGSIALATSRFEIANLPTAETDIDATFKLGFAKLYGAALSAADIAYEFSYRRPQRTANLTFYNPGNDAATVNVDRSGTGGDATLTGTPTDNASDPGIPWEPAHPTLAFAQNF